MLTKISAAACAVLLTGCSATNYINPFDDEHVNPVGAGPIKPDQDFGTKNEDSTRKQLAGLVGQSISECNQFRKHMVITVDSVDTLSDVASTTLSALATAFTPLATTHALSAAATIVSGNKAVIDSDIYAKASLSNLVTALGQTYYKKIAEFNASIPTLDLKKAPDVALNQLMIIHSQCSLDAIEASIGATLSPTGGTSTTPPTGGTGAPPPDGSGSPPTNGNGAGSGSSESEGASSAAPSPPPTSPTLPPPVTHNNYTGPVILPGDPAR